jgi:hypothetical protein
MKLRNYAIMISIFTLIEIAILALSTQGVPITQTSISKIGSLQGNYLFYLLATSILIIMFTLFLHKLYETLNREPRRELYFIPFLAVIALLFKASETMDLAKILHTALFVTIGILALIVVTDINKIINANKKTEKKFITAPRVALFGTIILFIIIGLNVITELVYIGAILSWIHAVGVTAGSI